MGKAPSPEPSTDGDRAIDYLLRRREYRESRRPALVLLDWRLPGFDGAEVLLIALTRQIGERWLGAKTL